MLDKETQQLEGTVYSGGEGKEAGMGGSWSRDIRSQEAEQDECWYQTCLLLSFSSGVVHRP